MSGVAVSVDPERSPCAIHGTWVVGDAVAVLDHPSAELAQGGRSCRVCTDDLLNTRLFDRLCGVGFCNDFVVRRSEFLGSLGILGPGLVFGGELIRWQIVSALPFDLCGSEFAAVAFGVGSSPAPLQIPVDTVGSGACPPEQCCVGCVGEGELDPEMPYSFLEFHGRQVL